MKKFFFAFMFCILIPGVPSAGSRRDTPEFRNARENMVARQIRGRGVTDKKVLEAMTRVPRHFFVPEKLQSRAYMDHPLPIGEGQTISQPYIVALMTESLGLKGSERVLEVGTGSGYQAAVLAETAGEVFTMEIRKGVFKTGEKTLKNFGYQRVNTRFGDGYFGWDEKAPFDCIMITAAVDHIPPPLLKQLKNNGKLILPLGNPFRFQNLVLVTKKNGDFTVRQITGVLFVPMTGFALGRNPPPFSEGK